MKIKNFARLVNIEISENCSLITAGNGVGKSSIINAWCWLLTGKDSAGKDMDVKIYDDRMPTEDWTAEVSATFKGLEISRKASVIMATERATLARYVKTRINTELFINNLPVNGQQWQKDLGIDENFLLTTSPTYFFNMDWKKQREIVNKVAISANPELANFDLKKSSERVKSLKSKQREIEKDQDTETAKLNATKDVEVPEISTEILDAYKVYQTQKNSDNTAEIQAINSRNSAKIRELAKSCFEIETKISNTENAIKTNEAAKFQPVALFPVPEVVGEMQYIETILTIDEWKAKQSENNFFDFPVVAENIANIKKLRAMDIAEFVANNPAACPLSGEACPTATLNAEDAKKKQNDIEVARLININRSDLDFAYRTYCNGIVTKNNRIERENAAIEQLRKKREDAIDQNKVIEIDNDVKESFFAENISKKQSELKKTLSEAKIELSQIPEFAPETLPEAVEVDESANDNYLAAKTAQDKAKGVNENNEVIKKQLTATIAELRTKMVECTLEITKIQNQIDEYLLKVKDVLTNCFSGKIKIDFQFYEQTLSGDYNETFRIFLDEKEFHNTALKLHAGVQLIAGFQKVLNTENVIFIDNAECTADIDYQGQKVIEFKFIENSPLKIS